MNNSKHIKYDEESDVLYISFLEEPIPAISSPRIAEVIYRYDPATGEEVGITIMNFKEVGKLHGFASDENRL